MSRKLKIKNLLFDIGGVIVLQKKVDFTRFDKKWSLPKGTVKEIVDFCFDKMSLSKDFNLKKYLSDTFSHYLSFKQYQEVTNQLFKSERVNKSLINWIRKNRKKYTICLLTNNTAILKRLLKKKFKIYQDFDFIFNSAEIGLSKPNTEFFKYVLKTLKTNPAQCLFIDNNPINVDVAKNLGFNAILFVTNKEFFRKISKFNFNENS